jgi:hypothetical protein
MQKTNSERLQEIAEGMHELNERLVYVGGAMAGSYADDPAATEPRTTFCGLNDFARKNIALALKRRMQVSAAA